MKLTPKRETRIERYASKTPDTRSTSGSIRLLLDEIRKLRSELELWQQQSSKYQSALDNMVTRQEESRRW